MSPGARAMVAWAAGLLTLEAQAPEDLERFVRIMPRLSEEQLLDLSTLIAALGAINLPSEEGANVGGRVMTATDTRDLKEPASPAGLTPGLDRRRRARLDS